MLQTTIHNPDSFMVDLRRILSQGRKRIGLLIGAGAPVALKINEEEPASKSSRSSWHQAAGQVVK